MRANWAAVQLQYQPTSLQTIINFPQIYRDTVIISLINKIYSTRYIVSLLGLFVSGDALGSVLNVLVL